MPVQCALEIESLSSDEFSEIDYLVMGQMFASQNELGRLADEQVYRADVAQRLSAIGLPCEEEVPLTLTHESFSKTLYLDLVVDQKAVYELKTVKALNSNHSAQLMTYLNLLNLSRGKLVNFRTESVDSKFVNAPIDCTERADFTVGKTGFRGDAQFLNTVLKLVQDWGTSLSVTLYRQALVHLLGGEDVVEQMLPMERSGRQLPNQRFQLLDSQTSFELTAFSSTKNDYADQLQRLLQLSSLQYLHWINISTHHLNIQTISKAPK